MIKTFDEKLPVKRYFFELQQFENFYARAYYETLMETILNILGEDEYYELYRKWVLEQESSRENLVRSFISSSMDEMFQMTDAEIIAK